MDYFAKDFGIVPEKEIARELSNALAEMAKTDGEKTLIFEQGRYHISAAECDEKMLYITNTVGDKEFKSGETPHLNRIGMNFQNINNLKFSGCGAEFIIDGKATNIAVENCENLELADFSIDVKNPEMHEFTVEKVSPFSVTFRLDEESSYKPYQNRFAFIGTDYETDFFENRTISWWNARLRAAEPHNVVRAQHPFMGALSIKEVAPYTFKLTYPITHRFKKGDIYYIFSTRRQYAGIFINASKNITLKNVAQHFNYSLALVCQDTENITVDSVDFSPAPSSKRLIISLADFVQICMCKGQVNVVNSNFSGACDDAINVHGVHFSVASINSNELALKFMHPQTHGYNPLHVGDSIDYVDPQTLLTKGSAEILSSRLADEETIIITVSSVDSLVKGDVIEDTTMCPDFYYAGNTLDRIITRNLLITTRGKVLVENNKFLNSTMACILMSDDAKNWFESGPVTDAEIRDNYFGQCYAEFISVLPENGKNTQPVHRNINIHDNVFDSTADKGISLKCAENVTIKNNIIKSSKVRSSFLRTVNCKKINSDI